MEIKIDFVLEAKKSLQAIPMQPVAIDPELQHIKAEGGSIDIEVYKADKMEKIVLCTIQIYETSVVEASLLAWPDDAHNFPILWCNLTIVPTVMNVPIFDFVPLMDIVVWPRYAETCIAGIADLKAAALEKFGDTIINKAVDLPSMTIYTLSPYSTVINITDEGVPMVPGVAGAYIQEYIKLWRSAQPAEKDDLAFYRKKKEATRALMKGNDPGYPFMIDVFGEEKTHKVFDIVF